jgi:hypothetical protein
LLKEGYQVRLILGDQSEIRASVPEQLLHLLHPLALCARHPITSAQAVRERMEQALMQARDGLTILVVPWIDPAHSQTQGLVDHVMSPESYRNLFHEVGPRFPA